MFAEAATDPTEDKTTSPTFAQRSISAPAIAENVEDAVLPTMYGSNYDVGNSIGSTNWTSGRLNRRPNEKKDDNVDEQSLDTSAYEDLLDDAVADTASKSTILSLSINPMDLIQADFPSTPSALFSNSAFLQEENKQTIPLVATSSTTSSTSPPKLDSAANEASLDAAALDTATNAFQQLYVQDKTAPALTSANAPSSLRPAQTFYPATSATAATGGGAATGGMESLLSTGSTNGKSLPGLKTSISTSGSTTSYMPSNGNYSALLGNQSSSIVNSGLNPLTPPVVSMASTLSFNGAASTATAMIPVSAMQGGMPAMQAIQPNGQVPQGVPTMGPNGQYFIPQPVYLDQNGNPVFYRPGLNQQGGMGQYPQEFMYQPVDGGQPIMGMAGDPNMPNMGMMPYGNQMGQGMPQNGYWANGQMDANGNMQPGQMNMYMQGPGTVQAGMATGQGNQRPQMVFNPATGQYVSQPMQAMNGRTPNGQMMNGMMNNGMMPIPTGMTVAPNNGTTPGGPPALLPRSQFNNGMGEGAMNPDGTIPTTGMAMPGNGMMLPNGMQMNNNGIYPMVMGPNGVMGPDGRDAANMNPMGMNGMAGMNGMGGMAGGMAGGMGGMNGMNMRNFNMQNDDYNRGDARGKDNYRNDRHNDRNHRGDRNDRDRDRDRDGRRGNNGNSTNGVNPVRDNLVEEFRSTYGKSRQWSLRDLSGHVTAFCQDQHGSRFIQQRLEVCPDADKQAIFDEIMPAAQSLITDVFGNYVLQKLFEYGTPEQCEALALLLKGQSVQLAMQMYGCRVVQKALEYVSTTRLIDLVTEFENPQLLLRCVHDSNGNHVIQKCIEIVSKAAKEAASPEVSDFLSGRIQFIITAFQGRVKDLSSHPYGCRVVQRILEHCSNNQKGVVLEELRQCCTDLVQDCYGNYVIQFVMQHGWEADRAVLIHEVQSNLLDFSQHKFASNVVEKCLQYASKKDRDEMIWTIINVTFDLKNPVDAKGHCVLESMVRDPYANYVVQKVIDVSDERQRAAIMRYVKENITQLRRYTYGKHIIVRLEKITNEKF